MTGMWISTPVLILCILITWTWAVPLQRIPGDQDSEEGDSDEDESSPSQGSRATPQSVIQNPSNQELTDKATLFLTQYFANQGNPDSPLHIPTNLNHTIVITVLPNNDTNGGTQNLVFAPAEGPPSFVGDIAPFFPLQQQSYPYQQFQQAQLPVQQQQPQRIPQGTPANLTPVQNLVGFVSKDKPPPVITRRTTEAYKDIPPPSTKAPVPTTTVAPVKEEPIDNIEDAILEALSIAEGGSGQGSGSGVGVKGGAGGPNKGSPGSATKQVGPPGNQPEKVAPSSSGGGKVDAPLSPSSPVNENFQALIDSGVIPGLSSSNNGIHVPSNFGPVFIQAEERPTLPSSGTTVFQNNPTPAPIVVPPPAAPPPIIFLQHLPNNNNINNNNNGNDNDEENTTVGRLQAPINAFSNIIGSISEANLGGVIQNTIKLAEAPVIQDTAKIATVTVLHNLFQAVNPCNFLGNCRPRPPLRIKKTE